MWRTGLGASGLDMRTIATALEYVYKDMQSAPFPYSQPLPHHLTAGEEEG